jgi:hypothetical protein
MHQIDAGLAWLRTREVGLDRLAVGGAAVRGLTVAVVADLAERWFDATVAAADAALHGIRAGSADPGRATRRGGAPAEADQRAAATG